MSFISLDEHEDDAGDPVVIRFDRDVCTVLFKSTLDWRTDRYRGLGLAWPPHDPRP